MDHPLNHKMPDRMTDPAAYFAERRRRQRAGKWVYREKGRQVNEDMPNFRDDPAAYMAERSRRMRAGTWNYRDTDRELEVKALLLNERENTTT